MTSAPFSGLRVLEMGSRTMVPYLGKLLVDGGADVVKIETPAGDPFRSWSATGADVTGTANGSAWFGYLNAGKQSRVLDLNDPDDRAELEARVAAVDIVLDDHAPAEARMLGIAPDLLRAMNPAAVVATLTRFGTTGPWANRPANDFILQALTGSVDARGVPGEEPVAFGGELGDFIAASMLAPAVAVYGLRSRRSGVGAHLDGSQFEAMMIACQTFRAMYDQFAPDYRFGRQIEIPSIEPASDGSVGYCTITGQQWQDFCSMIGAPELMDDPELQTFIGRMNRREDIWPIIRRFTESRTVDELVELASAFRIPTGPVGTGEAVLGFAQFVDRDVFVTADSGARQPRPAYTFSASELAPLRPAPELDGEGAGSLTSAPAGSVGPGAASLTSAPRGSAGSGAASLTSAPAGSALPLAGVKVLDVSAFFAGPFATNLLRVLGAELIKVESHVRLDGMRWASGLQLQPLWEYSPPYHGVNVGKTVVNLDLTTEPGREILEQLIAKADIVVENYSPRVFESWGLTWARIHELNERAIFMRMPAFGIEGPWRDRVGFAMTMEQVSGLANRTGHPDGPVLMPKGPVDFVSGAHAALGAVMALADRERTGLGQLVECPLITGALQAAAEQVVEWTAYGNRLERMGNASPSAQPQGLFESARADRWIAISVENDDQWDALVAVVGEPLAGLDRGAPEVAAGLRAWAAQQPAEEAAARLWVAGVPAADVVDFNESWRAAQLGARGVFQWADHPMAGATPYQSMPFQVDGQHLPLGGRAPLLGEHNDRVLADLGLSPAAIQALYDADVTGDWPRGIPRPDTPGPASEQ